MGAPAVGDVVLVTFPFSDLSAAKLRPAVCLADAGRGDWVLCQITSNAYGDPLAVPLDSPDFTAGGLLVARVVRPSKLFAASETLVARTVGTLTHATFQKVLAAVVSVLQPPTPVPSAQLPAGP